MLTLMAVFSLGDREKTAIKVSMMDLYFCFCIGAYSVHVIYKLRTNLLASSHNFRR